MLQSSTPTLSASMDYILHLADSALVLGQRNAEWCGHAPILEEDLSMANNSLDLIGQARLLYQHAATLKGEGANEDTLAYFRDVPEFRNYTLLELPHSPALLPSAKAERDWATTIVRNFLYSSLMILVWDRLQQSADPQLAAIAAKSLKEVRYHLRHSRDWVIRLGDGSEESHRRAQEAVDHLLPYTDEFWAPHAIENEVHTSGTGVDASGLRSEWDEIVNEALAEATLTRPAAVNGYVTQGKKGIHSEHLGYLLAEMQSLARAHPGATW